MRKDGTWDESRQKTADTICSYCGVGCTLTVHAQDNEIVKVTSPLDHSVTHGHLCIKGQFGLEVRRTNWEGTNAFRVNEEWRVKRPGAASGGRVAGMGRRTSQTCVGQLGVRFWFTNRI